MIEDVSPVTLSSTDGADTNTHSFRHDESEDQSISTSIIRAVASVSEVDPLSLQPRLYDVVDPDALERLFSSATGSGMQITFLFGSYEITVRGDGDIFVRETNPRSH